MGTLKLTTLFLLSFFLTINCGPIKKRHPLYHFERSASDCGSTHFAPLPTIIAGRAALAQFPLRYGQSITPFAPLPTIIAGRAALSPLPLKYAQPIPISGGQGTFRYGFTVPVPPSIGYPMARADDCSHISDLTAPEAVHLPAAPLLPSLAPPSQAAITTDCQEAPTLEYTPIAPFPPPPPPPAELLLQTPTHTEPCFETAQAPILTAPAPIYTEPAEIPPPPPSHITTEPLKSPGCFETAPAPTFVDAPTAPQSIELASPPLHHVESPVLAEPISTTNCNGAAPAASSFTFPSQPLEAYYGNNFGVEAGFPQIIEAKMLRTNLQGRTEILHPFARVASLAR